MWGLAKNPTPFHSPTPFPLEQWCLSSFVTTKVARGLPAVSGAPPLRGGLVSAAGVVPQVCLGPRGFLGRRTSGAKPGKSRKVGHPGCLCWALKALLFAGWGWGRGQGCCKWAVAAKRPQGQGRLPGRGLSRLSVVRRKYKPPEQSRHDRQMWEWSPRAAGCGAPGVCFFLCVLQVHRM